MKEKLEVTAFSLNLEGGIARDRPRHAAAQRSRYEDGREAASAARRADLDGENGVAA
jgi:hypothetical protein